MSKRMCEQKQLALLARRALKRPPARRRSAEWDPDEDLRRDKFTIFYNPPEYASMGWRQISFESPNVH